MILSIFHSRMKKATVKSHKSTYARGALEVLTNVAVTLKANKLFVDLYSENQITTI